VITKLLNEVNEKIETLNNLIQDKEYFEKLDERIEKVNNYVQEQKQEIERLNNIINRIKSIYNSLCFSAPENDFIFIEQLGEVLQELKGGEN